MCVEGHGMPVETVNNFPGILFFPLFETGSLSFFIAPYCEYQLAALQASRDLVPSIPP